jgi:hypothetical protein
MGCAAQGIQPTAKAIGVVDKWTEENAKALRSTLLGFHYSHLSQAKYQPPDCRVSEIVELEEYKVMKPFLTDLEDLKEAFSHRR